MQNEYLDEMLMALRANIEFLKKEGNSSIRVKNGQLVSNAGDLYIYEFQIEFLQNLDTDTDIELRLGGQSSNGKVIAVNDNEKTVQIQLESNLGASIAEATLIISSYYLLQLLCDKLESIEKGELKLTILAKKSFGLEPIGLNDKGYSLPISEKKLNPYQEDAVKMALNSEVSYIWGPPGTGKTQTIASIIEAYISKGLSTLLIAHTNQATDNALLKVVKHLKDTTDYADGKFIREGKIHHKELAEYKVSPEQIMEEKAKPIQTELNRLNNEIDKLNTEHSKLALMLKDYKRLQEVQENIDGLKKYMTGQKSEISRMRAEVKEGKESLREVEDQITNFQEKNSLMKFFSGTSLDKLTSNKAQVISEIARHEKKRQQLTESLEEATTTFEGRKRELENLEQEMRGFDFSKNQARVEKLEKESKNLSEQRSSLSKQLESLGDNLIEQAKVVATTLTLSYTSKKVLGRSYDCVILDEASMAPLPAVWCATGLAKDHVVLVGDFFQLPPIAKHRADTEHKSREDAEKEQALVNKWLKRDIFEVVGISQAIRSGKKPLSPLEQLKIQYRMNPDIAEVINALVYAKQNKDFALSTDGSLDDLGQELLGKEPLPGYHFGVYDTGDIGSIPVKTESGSFYNLTQGLIAVALAKKAIESGYKSVGIISAYRAQINLIQKIIKDEGLEKKVIADTVHRFQGDEQQIIIFDITTPATNTMYDDQEEEGDDEKLLNVALSRAKEKCILIANVGIIESKHSQSSLVRGAIDFCRKKGYPFHSTRDLIVQYSVDEKTENWLAKINNAAEISKDLTDATLFSENDFYQQFIRDLLDAKEEVIINSPFITSERTSKFVPIFSHLIKKGVNIFVMTRPAKEQSGAMVDNSKRELAALEELGVYVLPIKGRTHEKIGIIDRKILYEGSLNILSQRDSHEVMYRIAGEEPVKQMMGFMKLDKNLGPIGNCALKHCEVCTDPGSWYWTAKSKFGLWTFCLVGSHSVGKPPKTETEKKEYKKAKTELRKVAEFNEQGNLICPVHKMELLPKKGPFGPFWGCPKYKECGYLIDSKKADAALAKKG